MKQNFFKLFGKASVMFKLIPRTSQPLKCLKRIEVNAILTEVFDSILHISKILYLTITVPRDKNLANFFRFLKLDLTFNKTS